MQHEATKALTPTPMCRRVEMAKRELERMVDLLPQGIMLINRDGVVLRVNRALLSLAGVADFKDILGHNCRDLFPASVPRLDTNRIRMAFRNRTGPKMETLTINKPGGDNGHRVIEVTFFPAEKDAAHIMLMVDDVTERRESANRRERLQRLETARASLGGLLHTMNQPLTVIMSEAYMLAETCRGSNIDQQTAAAMAETIVRCVNELGQIMERIQNLGDVVMERYAGQMNIVQLGATSNKQAPRKTGQRHTTR